MASEGCCLIRVVDPADFRHSVACGVEKISRRSPEHRVSLDPVLLVQPRQHRVKKVDYFSFVTSSAKFCNPHITPGRIVNILDVLLEVLDIGGLFVPLPNMSTHNGIVNKF